MLKELYGQINTFDIEGLNDFSNKISNSIQIGDVVALRGDLGVGKTTLSGLIINNLLSTKQIVTSPTFNLVQTYEARDGSIIWHFDLYRLKSKEEAYNLAIEDAFSSGITIIEWPEIIWDLLPDETIVLDMDFSDDLSTRLIRINTKLNYHLK